jgi:uncharacterized Ntn-hydrolase superfamily protein
MTFSLVARCERTGQVGVGAVTAMRGVGKLVCHARAGVGAIATQAEMNPYHGYDGLDSISGGESASRTLDRLINSDPGRHLRQCGVVDANGDSAAWTGEKTPSCSGHLSGRGYTAQDNRLVGRETLEATIEAFRSGPELPLVERLLSGLEAGERTDADKDGALSANILVMGTEAYPLWDLRVDHSEDLVVELRDLYHKFEENLMPVIKGLPTREDQLGENARRQKGLSV